VHDEENIFGMSAAERMQQTLNEYQSLLVSSEGGWFTDFYQENHTVGGFAMFLKFNADGTAVVCSEIATNLPADTPDTSMYKLSAEQGLVLSFNTYNRVMHYFSEPYSSDVNGRESDYEFVIMKVASPNEIHLKGKKRNTNMVLRRNVNNLTPKEYFDSIDKFILDEVATSFDTLHYIIDNDTIAQIVPAKTFTTKRTFAATFTNGDKETISYSFAPDGIWLYEPIKNDKNVTEIYYKWNENTSKYESTNPNVNAAFVGYFAKDFLLPYDDLLGTWEMKYTASTVTPPPTTGYLTGDVQIAMKKRNKTFTMTSSELFSFPAGVGFELSYNLGKGTVSILAQALPKDFIVSTNLNVRLYNILASGSTGSGETPINNKYGVIGQWNNDEGGKRILTFVDNGNGGTAIGMRLRLYTLEGASGAADYSANVGGAVFARITLTKK
jgi:hypothetical protein